MAKLMSFAENNIFSELLTQLSKITQAKLVRQIEYLKIENEILRAHSSKHIKTSPAQRRKLLKYGLALGKELKNIISIVRYDTFMKWAKNSRKHALGPDKKRGRPKTALDIRELILRLAKENNWGYTRILGEIRKLGIQSLSRSSVKNILKQNNLDPVPERFHESWDLSIKRHFQTLYACDFFTKTAFTAHGLNVFYALFFINIKTRKVFVSGTTTKPTSEWVCDKSRSFLASLNANDHNKLLIRDRDSKYSMDFDKLFKKHGFNILKTPYMSPNLNAYAESWVGTIKRECLNHFFVFGERHLRYLIKTYVDYYNFQRPHSSMDNLPLDHKPAKNTGNIECQSKLGGLIRHYYRT